jgi:hypothetical protein
MQNSMKAYKINPKKPNASTLQLCYLLLLLLSRNIGNVNILNYSENEEDGVKDIEEDIEDEVQEMEAVQGNLNINIF